MEKSVYALDLDRLAGYLDRLGQRRLYAIVGFYLEGEASRLFVPPEFLERLARERPRLTPMRGVVLRETDWLMA